MNVFLGADHRGFEIKEKLVDFLRVQGFTVEDKGAFEKNPDDDYPDFAYAVAQEVARDSDARGILLCGSGTGMDVVANKVKGIRATVGYSQESTRHARTNDDVNVITLAADSISTEEAQGIARIFLSTPFSDAPRHARRLEKIRRIEEQNFV